MVYHQAGPRRHPREKGRTSWWRFGSTGPRRKTIWIRNKAPTKTHCRAVAQKEAEEKHRAPPKTIRRLKQAEDELTHAARAFQKNEIVSRIDAEKNQEALDEAQATFKQLKETYQLKRAASPATHSNSGNSARRAQLELHSQGNAAKMSLLLPCPDFRPTTAFGWAGRITQQGDQVKAGRTVPAGP